MNEHVVKLYYVASPNNNILGDILEAFQKLAKQSGDLFAVLHKSVFQQSYIDRSNVC